MHITAERLQAIIEKIFVGANVPKASAEQVAGSLVESNLVGHDSHGVLRITSYVKALEDGRVDPHGKLTILRESATTALIDGGANFGQIVARQAMDRAMNKARAHDIGMVAVRNSGHTGRLGEYSVQAARSGFIGMVMGSGSRKGGSVAPYGGISPVFNTNPITWGVPAAEHPPCSLTLPPPHVHGARYRRPSTRAPRSPWDGCWMRMESPRQTPRKAGAAA